MSSAVLEIQGIWLVQMANASTWVWDRGWNGWRYHLICGPGGQCDYRHCLMLRAGVYTWLVCGLAGLFDVVVIFSRPYQMK